MIVGSNLIASESDIKRIMSLETLKSMLTLPNPAYADSMRFGKCKWGSKPDKYLYYYKYNTINKTYILPRYVFGETPETLNNPNVGRTIDFSVNGSLRDYQTDFINEVDFTKTGILLEAGCGSGKTNMAIYIASKLKVQVLVAVPTYYLARQWKERIDEWSTAKSVILNPQRKDIPTDTDITIAVLDTLTCRELPTELISNVGLLILDEAHRLGAETYMPILDLFPAKYRLALTATFRRSDDVHKILKYHFGEVYSMPRVFPKPDAYALNTGVYVQSVLSRSNKDYDTFVEFLDSLGYKYMETKSCLSYAYSNELSRQANIMKADKRITLTKYASIIRVLNHSQELPYSTMESYLCENSRRVKLVVNLITECLNRGRTVLFLSKRKDSLKAMAKVFAEYKPMLIVRETNKRTDEENEYLKNECRLILGVNQLAKEGLDIDRLDTLIIHLPIKDTEQALGRISRLHPSKKNPVAIYLLDNSPITMSTYKKAIVHLSEDGNNKGIVTFKELCSNL